MTAFRTSARIRLARIAPIMIPAAFPTRVAVKFGLPTGSVADTIAIPRLFYQSANNLNLNLNLNRGFRIKSASSAAPRLPPFRSRPRLSQTARNQRDPVGAPVKSDVPDEFDESERVQRPAPFVTQGEGSCIQGSRPPAPTESPWNRTIHAGQTGGPRPYRELRGRVAVPATVHATNSRPAGPSSQPR